MSLLLNNIKSKYSLQNIFDFIPYNKSLKIIYGNKKLLQVLNISKETYQKYYEIKNILKPSYDIRKYFSYLDIKNKYNEKNKIKYNDLITLEEKILYDTLNNSSFNIDLYIENKGWENIIKYIHKIKLVISPKLINYIYKLDNDNKEYIFNLLNNYRDNIDEISICYFNDDWKINFEIINQILEILKKIFQIKNESKNIELSYNKMNNIIHENSNINLNNNKKKLSFKNNKIFSYIDISSKFFDKILSLIEIEGLFIDIYSFNEYQFSDIIKNISKKMKSLTYLSIDNFGINQSHYATLSILLSNANENIEILDLSHSFCISSILSILNLKKNHLKVIKLKICASQSKISWNFLEKNINVLEIFEIEIDNMINILNKMKNLTKLKIIGCLQLNQLINFKNKENIEYFNIDYNFSDDNIQSYQNELYNYFFNFKNLKYLTISNKSELSFFKFIFSSKLSFINLSNIKGENFLSLLKENKNHINHIKELKLKNSDFETEDFQNLIDLFSLFKSLLRLSLNKININTTLINLLEIENKYFYESIPIIFLNLPSLIELDISDNIYEEKIFKNDIFENIRLSIPKKLLSLKIFNNEIPISQKCFNYLIEIFGLVLDLDNNFPNIKKGLDLLDDFSENENKVNYQYTEEDIEYIKQLFLIIHY